MELLCVNTLLDWVNADNSRTVERLLWIAPGNSEAVLIDIFDKKSMPHRMGFDELCAAIGAGDCRRITDDPFAAVAIDINIPLKHIERRDRAWQLIEPIVQLPNGGAFDESQRFEVAERAGRQRDTSIVQIYRHLKRYWKRGQTKNALLPDYKNSGAPGKERVPGTAKRGRPRKLTVIDGLERGINIGPKEKKRLELGVKKFYENPNAANPPSLVQAYNQTIREYFCSGYKMADGVLTPIIASAHEIPSLGQFQYYANKKKNPTASIIAREGLRRFTLKARAIGGDAAACAFGPGSVYQIDSTPADLHLVNSFDPNRRISRPVLYFVVDVFSRLIAGVAVTLEEESYVSAMLALENALTDKVAYCERFGITIAPDDWPSHHIPEALVADRGELISKNADTLADTLGIRIVNTPAYRPDLKPFIERSFGRMNEVIHQLPGAVNQRHERGDKDERIDAVLTTNDFRKIVIRFVLGYNRSLIERFRFQEFMIAGNVEARPTDLWQWGITNRAGHLRTLSADALRLNLLPRGKATVTERGLRFEKLYYTCAASELGQWQVKARVNRSWKVEVAYHPHHTEMLYLVNGDRYEPCSLMQSNLQFGGRAWRELQDLKVIQSFRKDASATAELQTRTNRDTQIAAIVAEAMQRREGVEPPPSKAAAVADIRENRVEERDRERALAAAELAAAPEQPENIVPIPTIPLGEDGYVPPPSDFNLLRAQRAKHRKI